MSIYGADIKVINSCTGEEVDVEGGMLFETDPNGIVPGEPGSKLDKGKTRAGLLIDFKLALTAVAEVSTFGANKYSEGGWQHVADGIRRYQDAGWRHRLAEGEFDKDSGLRHKAHEAWNILAELEMILRETK